MSAFHHCHVFSALLPRSPFIIARGNLFKSGLKRLNCSIWPGYLLICLIFNSIFAVLHPLVKNLKTHSMDVISEARHTHHLQLTLTDDSNQCLTTLSGTSYSRLPLYKGIIDCRTRVYFVSQAKSFYFEGCVFSIVFRLTLLVSQENERY